MFVALLGALLIGWTLGYLNLPYFTTFSPFILGALSSAFAFLIILLFHKLFQNKAQGRLIVWFIMISGITCFSMWLYVKILREESLALKQNQILLNAIKREKVDFIHKKEFLRQRAIVEKAEKRLKNANKLTYNDIQDLSNLIEKLNPIDFYYEDSLIKCSPGKGLLLNFILKQGFDSLTKSQLFEELDFSYAFLKKAKLSGENLMDIRLNHAFLVQSDLSRANLSRAELNQAMLAEAKLDHVVLDGAKMERADLSYASIDHASLKAIEAIGANFAQASIQQSILDSSLLKWVRFDNCLMQESSFRSADFLSSFFVNANLSKCNLEGARMVRAKLSATDLKDAELKGLSLSEGKLEDIFSAVLRPEPILEEYQLLEGSSMRFPNASYFLSKKNFK